MLGPHDIRLDKESVGSDFADLLERLFRGTLVLEVVNRDFHAILGQCQRNPFSNSARTPGDQRGFSFERHMKFVAD